MSLFRNILVGLGTGVGSTPALEQAVALARRDNARLTLLAAVGSPPATIWWAPVLLEDPWEALTRDRESRLRSATRTIPDDVLVTTLLKRGEPARALLAELHSGRHDLVVLGGRARTGWIDRRGPVRRIVRRSPVPVLVAVDGDTEARGVGSLRRAGLRRGPAGLEGA